MSRILTIDPEKWDRVVAENLEEYPGRDVDSFQRNYMTTHYKNILMRNHHYSEESYSINRVDHMFGWRV